MERENFFILLELPFDPPVNDIAQIKAAINMKQQDWARLHNSPETRSIALHYIELLPEIEQVMFNDDSRGQEALHAMEIRKIKVVPFEAELRLLEAKSYILPREIKELTAKYGPYGISKDVIISFVNVPITDTSPKASVDVAAIAALDKEAARVITTHLSVLEEKDLYSFLGLPQDSSTTELVSTARAKHHEAFHAVIKTGKTSAAQLLCEVAIQIFSDPKEKASYDSFLSVNQLPDLNDLIQDEYKRSGFISPDMLIRLVNFGVTTYNISVLELEEYIRRYCKAYSITVDMAAPEITCPNCGESSPRGTVFCGHCAAPLEGNCPQCGTFFSGGQTVCAKCSFHVGSMGKALPYIEQVESSLNDNNWSSAQHGLSYIEQYWPMHPKYEGLSQRAEAVEHSYYDSIKAIEDAIMENRFYAAQQLVQKAESRNVQIPTDTLSLVKNTITDFNNKLSQLKLLGTTNYDSLHSLLSQVSDSLELDRMLSQYPPEPPPRITARPGNDQVIISWESSPSSGLLQYVLVRKELSVSLTAYDGEIVYEGDQYSFVDKHLPPLRNFFYSVFVKRGSSFSPMGAVASAPVKIIPDLKDLKIIPADGAAQLSWTPPSHVHAVKIWRKLGGERPTASGEGKLLETNRLDGFSDMKLTNDIEYWYYAVATYRTVEGDTLESPGICASVIPHQLITPVDQFEVITLEEEGLFLASWQGAPRDEILLFSSDTRPTHYLGQVAPTDELLYDYNRLQLDNQTSYSAKFRLKLDGGMYISPVAVLGRFGTMGLPFYLTNVPNVSNINYDISDSDLFLNFDWPKDYNRSVVVAWRKDDFPTAITQKNTQSLECTKEQYDLDSGVRIPDVSTGRYYMIIYTTFLSPEDKVIYSTGEIIMVDNTPPLEFFYDIVAKKVLFSRSHNVSISIETDTPFTLPRALIVGKVGHLPLGITDGIPLFEIARERDITKSIIYNYKIEELPKDMYMRMFFYDESNYQRLRPLPKFSLIIT